MLFESLSKDLIRRVLVNVENVMYITSPYDLDKPGLIDPHTGKGEFREQKKQVGYVAPDKCFHSDIGDYYCPGHEALAKKFSGKPDEIIGMGQPSPRILSTGMTKDNSMETDPTPNVYVEEGEIDILIFSKLSYNPIRLLDVINQIANVLIYPNLVPVIDLATQEETPWKPGVLIITYGSCEDDVFSQSERKQYRMSTLTLNFKT